MTNRRVQLLAVVLVALALGFVIGTWRSGVHTETGRADSTAAGGGSITTDGWTYGFGAGIEWMDALGIGMRTVLLTACPVLLRRRRQVCVDGGLDRGDDMASRCLDRLSERANPLMMPVGLGLDQIPPIARIAWGPSATSCAVLRDDLVALSERLPP